MMKRVSPLSAKLSMAHLRAFLLLLEKSRATPIFRSFTIFEVSGVASSSSLRRWFCGRRSSKLERMREETRRSSNCLKMRNNGTSVWGKEGTQFLCKVDTERDIASLPSTCQISLQLQTNRFGLNVLTNNNKHQWMINLKFYWFRFTLVYILHW